MSGAAPRVAIVGAGPAGLFTLCALLREAPGASVDVFERLPTPFGLVRSGVAPDHQGVKAVVRQFERAFATDRVRLVADCEVGGDIPLSLLADAYDMVFLATGAPHARRLGVAGEDLPGVYSAISFMGWLNGHPDHASLQPRIGERVVIVGGGNVALDVARVLAKTPREMESSDLCAHARHLCGRARSITIVARGGPEATRFSPTELKALSRLEAAAFQVELPSGADRSAPVVAALAALETTPPAGATRICFRFGLTAGEAVGEGCLEQVRFQRADGSAEALDADMLISAIGQQAALAGSEAVHAVGWASGERGDIPASRAQALGVVRQALETMRPVPRQAARARLDEVISSSGAGYLDWAAWKRIDQAEISSAAPPRPREKLVSWAALRATARLHETNT